MNENGGRPLVADRVKRAARHLRKLEASGVELHRILGGDEGADFIRDECGGDVDVAAAAFALVYSAAECGRVGDSEYRVR
jgi:hypothetical protein